MLRMFLVMQQLTSHLSLYALPQLAHERDALLLVEALACHAVQEVRSFCRTDKVPFPDRMLLLRRTAHESAAQLRQNIPALVHSVNRST